MTTSFRSSQGLLDAARNLIVKNENRLETQLGLDKTLRGVPDNERMESLLGPAVSHLEYETVHDEIEGIGTEIIKLVERSRANGDDLSFGDFAVLVRQNWDIPKVVSGLHRLGIPTRSSSGKLFLQKEVQFLMSLLSAIVEPSCNRSLYELVSYYFSELSLQLCVSVYVAMYIFYMYLFFSSCINSQNTITPPTFEHQ